MTNAQFNGYLELIARLIEAKAVTPTEAADLVRQSKVSERKTKKESASATRKVK